MTIPVLRRDGLTGAAALGSGLAVGYLADCAGEHDGPSRLDPRVAGEVLHVRSPTGTALAHLLSLVGSEVVVGTVALIALAVLLRRRDLARALPFAVAMGGSVALTVGLKLLVARPRPGRVDVLGPVDHSYSFPSGHTLNSAVLIAMLVWLAWDRCTVLGRVLLVESGMLLTAAVASSRLYLGYHWLTDVVASVLVAVAWLGSVVLLRRPVASVARRVERRLGWTRSRGGLASAS